MALLELRDVEKVYQDGTRALAGVSFSIESGEFVAVMGPSGCGKSTLLHILGFLDHLTKGEYLFEGNSADDYREEEIAHIRNREMGFIFQAFNLLARATVLENIMLPLLYSGIKSSERETRAREAIETVGLSNRITHASSQLSGGERQRVAIARALVNNPNLIFADEPTGNLDSKAAQQVMKIIQQLHKEGHTVILITHDPRTAENAERIIRMLDGKIESDTSLK